VKKVIKIFISYFLDKKLFIVYFSKNYYLGKLYRYYLSAPAKFKQKLFVRYSSPNTTWIETGTYEGDTTELLSNLSNKVYSIEPSDKYYQKSFQRLKKYENVKLFHGTSEECLETVLKKVNSENVSFWLDGHFSYGDTFEGPNHNPVLIELEIIKKYSKSFKNVNILIDDIRTLTMQYSKSDKFDHPPLNKVIDWVNNNKFTWHISRNILVMNRKA